MHQLVVIKEYDKIFAQLQQPTREKSYLQVGQNFKIMENQVFRHTNV